ncbi:MAG TPA: hypothetical protein ENK57_00065, partial [Polyangiaceae bacterium]|nr:hypothetical protein [Polyangiaceae bacterium]
MAVKDGKAKGEAPRSMPRKPRGTSGPHPAEKFNVHAFAGTLGSWVLILIGQRVLDADDGKSMMFTALGVVGLVVCFGQRIWATMGVADDRRASAQLFAVLNGLGLVALALYAATTDW